VFAISAALAGVAGALMTQTTQFTSPETLGFQRSADVLTMLIVGGAGCLYGALVGAFAFVFMQDMLATLDPIYWYFWIGLALVLIVSFFRRGIVPTLIKAWSDRRSRAGDAT
jgi:branched-chain amino acid transport system permease protein